MTRSCRTASVALLVLVLYFFLPLADVFHFVKDCVDRRGRLFYTHDPQWAASSLMRDERGRVIAVEPVAAL